jgi:hypothetical protein
MPAVYRDKGEMWQPGPLEHGKGTNPTTVPTKWIEYRISWDGQVPARLLLRPEFDATDLMNRRNKVMHVTRWVDGRQYQSMMATMDLVMPPM